MLVDSTGLKTTFDRRSNAFHSVYSHSGGSDYYVGSNVLIRLLFTCFHALKLQQLPRVQKFDLLTFLSLDHHCNGWVDSTWTSWPVEPLTEGLLVRSVRISGGYVKALKLYARSDLLHPSAASAAHQKALINSPTQKKHKRVYNWQISCLHKQYFIIMGNWCYIYSFI